MSSRAGVSSLSGYSCLGKEVLDQRGIHMADCRDDATAEIITMALNTTFPWVTKRECMHPEVDFATLSCKACGATPQ